MTTAFKIRIGAAILFAGIVNPSLLAAQEKPPTGYSSLDVTQPAGSKKLQRALLRLASNSRDVRALNDAGYAALELGDTRAAIGFFARAEQISPKNGQTKAGLGTAILLEENPFEALKLFDEAVRLGVPQRDLASDRGLAFDLIGNNQLAQQDYRYALANGKKDDELIRRYALSLGIAGKTDEAELQLNPLLHKRDPAAWRARAFIMAMNGDRRGARAIAEVTMPARLSEAIKPFLKRLKSLSPAQQAAAVHFGHFPASENVGVDLARVREAARRDYGVALRSGDGADAGLIPAGRPLGSTAKPATSKRKLSLSDKKPRRRPGKLRVPIATPAKKKRRFATVLTATKLPEPGNARPVVTPVKKPSETPIKTPASTAGSSTVKGKAAAVAPGFESLETTRLPADTKQKEAKSAFDLAIAQQSNERPTSSQTAEVSDFDLASKSKSVADVAPAAQQPAKTTVALSDIMGSLTIPKSEREQAVVPVDLAQITAAKPAPVVKEKPKKAKPEPPKHPKRYWAQIASGRNIKALRFDWRRLSKKAPASFKGLSSWTAPLGKTNRLLAGPFDSSKAAQKFVNAIGKKGISALTWTSPAGREVTKLSGK